MLSTLTLADYVPNPRRPIDTQCRVAAAAVVVGDDVAVAVVADADADAVASIVETDV